MGGFFTKKYINYELPFKQQSVFSSKDIRPATKSKAYQSHLIANNFEAKAYALQSKTQLLPQTLLASIHPKPEYLTLLTYNVWFEEKNIENRYPCILKMLFDSDADIICLQEVTGTFINYLYDSCKALTKSQEYYIPIIQMHWYDTIILSKYPCRFYKKKFENSSMDRCNLTAVIEFQQQDRDTTFKLAVNCVHLQSLNNQKQRMNQLEQITKMNQGMDMSIVAGDFNFADGWKQNQSLSSYNDVWKKGKRHFNEQADQELQKSGYTMPKTGQFQPVRFDHIVYRRKKQQPLDLDKKNQISIIGNFTICPFENDKFQQVEKDNLVRTPSDHFGLFSKIYL